MQPERLAAYGAKPPSGILLFGPPGAVSHDSMRIVLVHKNKCLQ